MKPNTYPASAQKREMDPSVARAAAEAALAAPSTKTVEWNNGINASLTEHTHTVLVTEPGARIPAELFTGRALLVKTQNGERMATDFEVAVSMPKPNDKGNFVRGSNGLGQPAPMRGWSVNQEPSIGNDLVVGEELNGSRIEAITISMDDLLNRRGLSLPEGIDQADVQVDAPDPSFAAEGYTQQARTHFGL